MKTNCLLLLTLLLTVGCKKKVQAQDGITSSPITVTDGVAPETSSTATTVRFSGYTWTIKNGPGIGPGPNNWSSNNAWVDSNGWMHLKLSYDEASGKWLCAGITSNETFSYGTFQWKIQGPVSTLDKNVVAGLFHYNGPDGYNEMDVEFARWGNPDKPNVNYSVYPAPGSTIPSQHFRDNWTQTDGTSSTHRYTWTSDSVVFKSMNGMYDDDTNLFSTHTFKTPATSIPSASLPVKMNLWCFKGLAPSNGQNVEVVIKEFKYIAP